MFVGQDQSTLDGVIRCDVLIVGAGPAGSSAAITLARVGCDVVLIDRYEFPRDKVCGDALIPDSLAAIQKLNLGGKVAAQSLIVKELRIFSPNGTQVTLQSQLASQPRESFDALLQAQAVEAGAKFLAPHKVLGPLEDAGSVSGARFAHATSGTALEVQARITLLATGAASGPLKAFGVCTEETPSAMAARAYFRVPEDLSRRCQHLVISYDAAICPGYGWIFPGPRSVFNVGVGVFRDAYPEGRMPNLRQIWATFLTAFEPAAAIAAHGTQVTPLKGAPLRTAMRGSQRHRPGLLVLGEAAGLTFSFSGEGIGKAMESGIIAAELVAEHLADKSRDRQRLGSVYETALEIRFSSIFRGYKRVQDWLSRPAACNFLAWRANRSKFVVEQLEGILSESVDPRELFSLGGLLRSLYR